MEGLSSFWTINFKRKMFSATSSGHQSITKDSSKNYEVQQCFLTKQERNSHENHHVERIPELKSKNPPILQVSHSSTAEANTGGRSIFFFFTLDLKGQLQ